MVEAVERFVQNVPNFGEYFRTFDAEKEIDAPYLFMFYCTTFMSDVLRELDSLSRSLVNKFHESIKTRYGYEYESARKLARKGLVARHLFKYLIQPGDVLVDIRGSATQAYVAMDWAKEIPASEEEDYEEYDPLRRKRTPKWRSKIKVIDGQKSLRYSWEVPLSYWKFDGAFEMCQKLFTITMKVGYEEEMIQISQLNIFPLAYAPKQLRATLERRGKMFWKLRHKRFVTYNQHEDEKLNSVGKGQVPTYSYLLTLNMPQIDERYMVDIETYKRLHPSSKVSKASLRADLDPKELASDEPPQGSPLLLFPPTIVGYNMLRKNWSEAIALVCTSSANALAHS